MDINSDEWLKAFPDYLSFNNEDDIEMVFLIIIIPRLNNVKNAFDKLWINHLNEKRL